MAPLGTMERVARGMVLIGFLSFSAFFVYRMLTAGRYLPDYSVFWTAGRMVLASPGQLYDPSAMTEAQSWLTGPPAGPRPFAYPPTSLLLFVPFSWLPFWLSLIVWNAVSLSAFVAAARRFVSPSMIALAILSPPVVVALASGQTALLTAAAAMTGVSWLPRRPVLAGLVLGLAVGLKPQSLLLAPVALVAAQEWKALASFCITGTLVIGASLVFGLAQWQNWLAHLPDFLVIVSKIGLDLISVTPASMARLIGVSSTGTMVVEALGTAAGIALVFWAFRRDDPALRVIALVAGTLLCLSYAMGYELAALAPFAAASIFSRRPWGLGLTAPFIGLGAIGLVAMVGGAIAERSNDRDSTKG